MSFKRLFRRSLGANPGRLHFGAHSHHLWPDAAYEGQMQAMNDAARLADCKWDKIMDEVWPAAQAEVAAELGTGQPNAVVFAPNTHELLVRLVSAFPSSPIRVLTSDGEFHSARRQLARWEEAGSVSVQCVAVEPFDTFADRFVGSARRECHDLILVSEVMFASGRVFGALEELAALGRPEGPWVLIDGYHAFMALPSPLGGAERQERFDRNGDGSVTATTQARPSRSASRAFYLGGGYKYAMSGEGCAFLHAPEGYGARPSITGWFAEFEDLSLPPGGVGYAADGRRFLGATFDPSGLYRFLNVREMLRREGLTTKLISGHVDMLQQRLLEQLHDITLGACELLNPLGSGPHARFLAFRSPNAPNWYAALKARNCITDVRGDVLRIGFGLYHDEVDVEQLAEILGELA